MHCLSKIVSNPDYPLMLSQFLWKCHIFNASLTIRRLTFFIIFCCPTSFLSVYIRVIYLHQIIFISYNIVNIQQYSRIIFVQSIQIYYKRNQNLYWFARLCNLLQLYPAVHLHKTFCNNSKTKIWNQFYCCTQERNQLGIGLHYIYNGSSSLCST